MKIGFIGGGVASEVVITYMKDYITFVDMKDVYVYEENSFRLNQLRATYPGINMTYPNLNFVRNMDILFISEKVNDINETMKTMRYFMTDKTIICTMIPGLQIKTVAEYFPLSQIVRIALNFPLVDKEGIIVFSTDIKDKSEEMDRIAPFMTLFHDGGKLLRVSEEVMDVASVIVFGSSLFQTMILQREAEILSSYGISKEDALLIASQVKIGVSKQAQLGHTPLNEIKTLAEIENDSLAKSMIELFSTNSDKDEFRDGLRRVFGEQFEEIQSRSKKFNEPFEPVTEVEEDSIELPPEEEVYTMRYRWDDDE